MVAHELPDVGNQALRNHWKPAIGCAFLGFFRDLIAHLAKGIELELDRAGNQWRQLFQRRRDVADHLGLRKVDLVNLG